MNKALGFSATVFGLGSGIFFVGYFLFEIPSNLILAKVGARRWIARILLTWGIISGLTAFVWSANSFYAIRFLLGLAEAGYYPGIILFLTWWFPVAIPLAHDRPVHDGHPGRRGDRLDVLRLPAGARRRVRSARLAVAVPDRGGAGAGAQRGGLFLPDRRAGGCALAAAGAARMAGNRLAAERSQRELIRHYRLGETMCNPRVWALTLIYFGQNVTGYGVVLFLPQIVKRFGMSNVQTGFVTALPYLFGVVALILWGMRSDRTGERSKHCAAACLSARRV